MTDVKDLVLTIVRPLVSQPESVHLEVAEGDQFMEYNLTVAPDDIGRIIGKQGRVAKRFELLFIVYALKNLKRFD